MFRDMWHRCQIRRAVQTPNATGGIDTTFEVLNTVWCDITPIDLRSGRYLRDVQTDEVPTHKITMRHAQSTGTTRYHLKSNCYLYIEEGDPEGREFKIMAVTEVGERSDYLEILVMERRTVFGSDGVLA